jgi:hypothetical protein
MYYYKYSDKPIIKKPLSKKKYAGKRGNPARRRGYSLQKRWA